MTSTSDEWEKNIAKAVNQTDRSAAVHPVRSGLTLPNWFPLAISLVFGFMLAELFVSGDAPHSVNDSREYETGSRVALLMVAEDVESYVEAYGELPEDSFSPIASVMNVTYEKLSDEHFKLTMPFGDEILTFEGKEKVLSYSHE